MRETADYKKERKETEKYLGLKKKKRKLPKERQT